MGTTHDVAINVLQLEINIIHVEKPLKNWSKHASWQLHYTSHLVYYIYINIYVRTCAYKDDLRANMYAWILVKTSNGRWVDASGKIEQLYRSFKQVEMMAPWIREREREREGQLNRLIVVH